VSVFWYAVLVEICHPTPFAAYALFFGTIQSSQFKLFLISLWYQLDISDRASVLTGKSTLGFLHSAYAIGALFGVLYGGALVQMGESVLNILILLMFILTPLAFVFMFGLMSFREEIEMRKIEEAVTITDEDQLLTEAQKIDLANELSRNGGDIEQRDVEAVDTTPLSPADDLDMEGNRNTFSHNNPDIIDPNEITAMTHSPAASIPEMEEQKADRADYWNLILLCSLGGLAYTGEGSVGDWSTVYLVINLKSSPLIGVLGFAMFQIITAIARYCSDYIDADRRVSRRTWTSHLSYRTVFT
jgi:hypothetical protein